MEDIFGRELKIGDFIIDANQRLKDKSYAIVVSDYQKFDLRNRRYACECCYKVEHPCKEEEQIYKTLVTNYKKFCKEEFEKKQESQQKAKERKQNLVRLNCQVGDILEERKRSNSIYYMGKTYYVYLGYIRITDNLGIYEGYGYIRFYQDRFDDLMTLGIKYNSISFDNNYLLAPFILNKYPSSYDNILSDYSLLFTKKESERFNKIITHINIVGTECEFNYPLTNGNYIKTKIELLNV